MIHRAGLGNVVVAPISEVLARVVVLVMETVSAAKDILIDQESLRELSAYLEKILPVLNELQDKNVRDTPPMRVALESLERAMKSAQEKMKLCASKSRIYLLVNCRNLVKEVQDITREVGRCLSLMPLATMNISVDSREILAKLFSEMQNAEFRAAAADEVIVDKIKMGLRDRRMDSGFANELLVRIAQAVGISSDALSLKRELEQFKRDQEEIKCSKQLQEAYQLEQIIALLSAAGGAANIELTTQASAKPLPSTFYCPLTGEVMLDPVELVVSGQTFERSAIEKWVHDGNDVCPVTSVKLDSTELNPNIALKQSIEQWKERRTRSAIAASASKLQCANSRDVESSLQELHKLIMAGAANRMLVADVGLVPVMVGLLKSKQKQLRKQTLTTLCSLAVEDENKERIVDAGALPSAVKSLARDSEEIKEAVALLLELSKVPGLCDQIGKEQGSILLLATILQNGSASAAGEARILLDRLSANNQYVVQMAEANYFKPLALRLQEGSEMDKVLMASAIARLILTDQGKASLSQKGAIGALVKMLSFGSLEARAAALGALQNLSTVEEGVQEMVKAGLVSPLLKLLCSVTSSLVTLKQRAATTFANLAASNETATERNEVLESEETLSQLLSLLNLAGPEIQGELLRAIYGIASRQGAAQVRKFLREADGIALLLPFCSYTDSGVRLHALKLLHCLSREGAEADVAECLQGMNLKMLVEILSGSIEEEKAAVAGILASLPLNDVQTTRLVQAGTLEALGGIIARAGEQQYRNPIQEQVVENATGALLHFTRPSREDTQRVAAKMGLMACLVALLRTGSSLAKSSAAVALGQFSESTRRLAKMTAANKPKATTRTCGWFFGRQGQQSCKIHRVSCSVETTFCLQEAGAVVPLLRCVDAEEDVGVQVAALTALASLVNDECWERGVEALAEVGGVQRLVKVLSAPTSNREAQDKAVWVLERVFRVAKLREEFGPSATMPLVELTQKGSSFTKPLAAKVLAHLGTLHTQSSYF